MFANFVDETFQHLCVYFNSVTDIGFRFMYKNIKPNLDTDSALERAWSQIHIKCFVIGISHTDLYFNYKTDGRLQS